MENLTTVQKILLWVFAILMPFIGSIDKIMFQKGGELWRLKITGFISTLMLLHRGQYIQLRNINRAMVRNSLRQIGHYTMNHLIILLIASVLLVCIAILLMNMQMRSLRKWLRLFRLRHKILNRLNAKLNLFYFHRWLKRGKRTRQHRLERF